MRIRAEITAYYPSNEGVEGGYYDALGNLLNPNYPTCAAPPEIPFYTMIKISDTNTKYDDMTFEVLDRGSAIIIDDKGIYHIDLLMHNKEEANAFGRRKNAYIEIIEDQKIENKKSYNCKVSVFGCRELNVRDSRPIDGKLGCIKFKLKENDIVTLGYVYNNWGSIYVDGKCGFVNVKYLKII